MNFSGLFGPPDIDALQEKRDITGLIKALGYQKSAIVRENAAIALGEIGDEKAVDALIGALNDQHPGVGVAAADALGEIGDAKARNALISILEKQSVSDKVKEAAFESLEMNDWTPSQNSNKFDQTKENNKEEKSELKGDSTDLVKNPLKMENTITDCSFWKCPNCGELLQKKDLNTIFKVGESALNLAETETCGACGCRYPGSEIYGGKYDSNEIVNSQSKSEPPHILSIVVFRIKTNKQTNNPHIHCRKIMDIKYPLSVMYLNYEVGFATFMSEYEALALYNSLVAQSRIQSLGTKFDLYSGTDNEGIDYIAILFSPPLDDWVYRRENNEERFHKSTRSIQEAIDICFNSLLPKIPEVLISEVNEEFTKVKSSWASEKLHSGSELYVKEIMRRNMGKFKNNEDFMCFTIESVLPVSGDIWAGQIDIAYSNSFIPIRIWKAENTYFVCGNSKFTE